MREPWKLKENVFRLYDNIRNKKTLTKRQLENFFPKEKFIVTYKFGLDAFNMYDSSYHKLLERLVPCKYVAIVELKV